MELVDKEVETEGGSGEGSSNLYILLSSLPCSKGIVKEGPCITQRDLGKQDKAIKLCK